MSGAGSGRYLGEVLQLGHALPHALGVGVALVKQLPGGAPATEMGGLHVSKTTALASCVACDKGWDGDAFDGMLADSEARWVVGVHTAAQPTPWKRVLSGTTCGHQYDRHYDSPDDARRPRVYSYTRVGNAVTCSAEDAAAENTRPAARMLRFAAITQGMTASHRLPPGQHQSSGEGGGAF
jgi:hypothetical protein